MAHAGLVATSLPGLVGAVEKFGWLSSLIACVPLVWLGVWASASGVRTWRVFAGVWLGQIPLWALQLWWVMRISELGFYPLVALQSVYAPVFVLLMRWIAAHLARMPLAIVSGVLWAGVEFLRGEVLLSGFSWGLVGHALIDAPVLAWPAQWGGVYAVSLLCAALAGALIEVRVRARAGVVSIALIALMWLGGGVLTPAAETSDCVARFGVVQTNLPQDNKLEWSIEDEVRDFRRFVELTREASTPDAHGRRPDVIIWPETMMPGLTLEPSALQALSDAGVIFRVREGVTDPPGNALRATVFADELLAFQERLNVPLVIGEEALVGLRVEQTDAGVEFKHEKRYNSAFVIREGIISRQRYDKIRLTPFGEYMPIISHWSWLEQRLLAIAAGGMRFDLDEGKSTTPLSIPLKAAPRGVLRMATPICFEVTDARHCRRLVFESGARKADVLVNLTNDGWFTGSDLARRQHLQAARWRAYELATPVVRAANTGISCVIDARGRVVDAEGTDKSLPPRTAAMLVGDVALPASQTHPTVFSRIGNPVGWVCFTVMMHALFGVTVEALQKYRTSRRARM